MALSATACLGFASWDTYIVCSEVNCCSEWEKKSPLFSLCKYETDNSGNPHCWRFFSTRQYFLTPKLVACGWYRIDLGSSQLRWARVITFIMNEVKQCRIMLFLTLFLFSKAVKCRVLAVKASFCCYNFKIWPKLWTTKRQCLTRKVFVYSSSPVASKKKIQYLVWDFSGLAVNVCQPLYVSHVHGAPRIMPYECWDRLQQCDPNLDMRLREKWKEGWMDIWLETL